MGRHHIGANARSIQGGANGRRQRLKRFAQSDQQHFDAARRLCKNSAAPVPSDRSETALHFNA
jgi:hypothetical protein